MKPRPCPECGGNTKRFAGAPYCEQCGWKVAEAQSRLAPGIAILVFFPVIFFFGGLILFGLAVAAGAPLVVGFMLWGGVGVALGFWYASHRKFAARLKELAERFASRPTKPPGQISDEERARYAWLVNMGRPRSIRMPLKAKLGAIVGPLTALAALWFLSAPMRQRPGPMPAEWEFLRLYWIPVLAAVMVVLGNIWWILDLKRQRQLLREGKVAIARITRVRDREDDRRLWFEFQDDSGKTWQGKGLDRSNELWEAMVVPVFYDPDDPGRHVPLSGTQYEIIK